MRRRRRTSSSSWSLPLPLLLGEQKQSTIITTKLPLWLWWCSLSTLVAASVTLAATAAVAPPPACFVLVPHNHDVSRVVCQTMRAKRQSLEGRGGGVQLYAPQVKGWRTARLFASTSLTNEGDTNVANPENEDNDDDNDNDDYNDDDDEETEWVLEEYDRLMEPDFYRAEFKVGTLWGDGDDDDDKDENANKKKRRPIEETWVRLLVDDTGSNVAIWGDGAQGKWSLEKPSSDGAPQFFSISKDSWGGWLGKKIWAGLVDDYYFLEGTVRGWSPLQPAAVLGQWQAKRLGVNPQEMGEAPWFQQQQEQEEQETEGGGGETSAAEEEE